MINLLLRVVINAVALWVAAQIVDGISLSDNMGSILFVAVVFGLVNAFIRPFVLLLSLPFLILTLGLFTLVVNTAMLGLTAWLTDSLRIDGFWSAFLGAIVISIISWVLSLFLPDEWSGRRPAIEHR